MVGDIAHICNRGFDKKPIFTSMPEYHRFVENLYRLNNQNGALRFQGRNILTSEHEKHREPIVDILKWSLLPNHYHLLLHERIEGGITEFVKRLGNGYTKYFNTKHQRSGYLFQNSAKIILIKRDAQFLYIPFYIELNPLDIHKYPWRDLSKKTTNYSRVIAFLEKYPWSSYQDYVGKPNFPKIINQPLFFSLFETNPMEYKKEVQKYLLNTELPPVNLAG